MACTSSGRHTFSFEGGDQLTTIGATFFVSYLYHLHVDPTHRNWASIKTQKSRISTIKKSGCYHSLWLKLIGGMSDVKLNRNKLNLDASSTKKWRFPYKIYCEYNVCFYKIYTIFILTRCQNLAEK